MNARKTRDLPARLENVRRRFAEWRKAHRARSPLASSLWAAAVKMAGRYGLNRTARALRVDYYSLKKRTEQRSADRDRPALDGAGTLLPWSAAPAGTCRELSAANAFVELSPSLPAAGCDCTLELEDADGSRMRVHLKTAAPPDLTALCRSFRNPTL